MDFGSLGGRYHSKWSILHDYLLVSPQATTMFEYRKDLVVFERLDLCSRSMFTPCDGELWWGSKTHPNPKVVKHIQGGDM